MRCPDCGGATTVADTKDSSATYSGSRNRMAAKHRAKNEIRRRRKCLACGARFGTVERVKNGG